ncbi:hypothetical protein ACFUKV_33860 [Streptomyces paradoxus]|uniref:hypothetical protein n=1 Tax=Streptomyces paradoxus TaxID=66375 RepID=UPI0036298D04
MSEHGTGHGGEPDITAAEEWLTAVVREAVGEVPRRLAAEVAGWPPPGRVPPPHGPCPCAEPDTAEN